MGNGNIAAAVGFIAVAGGGTAVCRKVIDAVGQAGVWTPLVQGAPRYDGIGLNRERCNVHDNSPGTKSFRGADSNYS